MEKKRILVIDDEEGFTKLIKLNLENTGKYEVKAEQEGALGLAVAKKYKPDLILLDVLMPNMEGSEVARQLKNDMDTKNIPIVFVTAVVEKDELKGYGGVIGGYDFIAKPVDIKQVIDVIEKNIG